MARTAEMKAGDFSILEQREQEKKQEPGTTYQRVYEPYRARMERSTTNTQNTIVPRMGPGQRQVEHKYGYPIQNAMGTLLRAVYGVDAVAKLPASRKKRCGRYSTRF